MNANELADLLYTEDVQFSQQSVNGWAEEAITMLRKQQESIEGLNRDYDLLFAEHQLLLKKEWVGLTYDDIYKIHTTLTNEIYANFKTFAYAIEAKLKNKNGYTEEKNK